MLLRSNVHMHNNRSRSKCLKDCLYAGMNELYAIAILPLGLHNTDSLALNMH